MTGAGPIFTLHHTDESPGEHWGAGVIQMDSSEGTHLLKATGTLLKAGHHCAQAAVLGGALRVLQEGGEGGAPPAPPPAVL